MRAEANCRLSLKTSYSLTAPVSRTGRTDGMVPSHALPFGGGDHETEHKTIVQEFRCERELEALLTVLTGGCCVQGLGDAAERRGLAHGGNQGVEIGGVERGA